jgi:hypothetical protein
VCCGVCVVGVCEWLGEEEESGSCDVMVIGRSIIIIRC